MDNDVIYCKLKEYHSGVVVWIWIWYTLIFFKRIYCNNKKFGCIHVHVTDGPRCIVLELGHLVVAAWIVINLLKILNTCIGNC